MTKPRPSRITIPQHAHPLARAVFELMRQTGTTYDELEYYSGVLRSTIKAWRSSNTPGLGTIAACLGYMGYDLLPVPRKEHIPADLAEALDELASRWADQGDIVPLLMGACARLPNHTKRPVGSRWAEKHGLAPQAGISA